MTSNGMSRIARKFSAIQCYQVGDTRISHSTKGVSDYNTLCCGLSLFIGVLLDYNERFCSTEIAQCNEGRILSYVGSLQRVSFDFSSLQGYLDSCDDVLLAHISSEDPFKGGSLLSELKTLPHGGQASLMRPALFTLIGEILRSEHESLVAKIESLHQIFCFLKKLDIERADLDALLRAQFFSFEDELSTRIMQQTLDPEYLNTVREMRQMLRVHLDQWNVDQLVPKHGPGAVSDAKTKTWFDKHYQSNSDRRIAYLLDHARLGVQSDYLPFVKEGDSSRTSRFITVPKTWKKLRGISAEPAELQFWQQGVLHATDMMFRHDKWWSSHINLHDQTRSQKLAQAASVTGDLATIDLSAASDSVSLQLVKDVFGNTSLGRWLVGTRSTHTMCDNSVVRLHKFAPMGSACCFPTECMIFLLAARVACCRAHVPSHLVREVQVFGDDIIIPTLAAQELLKILTTLGFSINMDKSYWSGHFREACGIEAWNGTDIRPCRYKAINAKYGCPNVTGEVIATAYSLSNQLFFKGLHRARQWLLDLIFSWSAKIGKGRAYAMKALEFSPTGESSTLASPQPTNFHLDRKYDPNLQTLLFRKLVWRRKSIPLRAVQEKSLAADVCNYTDWLIRHQPGNDSEEDSPKSFYDTADLIIKESSTRKPLDIMMVPTLKWVLPSRINWSGVIS